MPKKNEGTTAVLTEEENDSKRYLKGDRTLNVQSTSYLKEAVKEGRLRHAFLDSGLPAARATTTDIKSKLRTMGTEEDPAVDLNVKTPKPGGGGA